ncbi:protoporphyrinogen oxidase [Propionibacterium freudenreichii]|uniref:protoporphyrinogen oxidase n=1 Tax=Propionibacterium freudenreichii TaxID=1744 RepID=UPI0005432125|nr:protoporphyrinogen oxidase [Propionibacterium freudenreichii]MDK9302499.1 protoporphyrinogen oxidase [Propionibacterium freudenreichii]MDK9322251.1 protoporphyrinogen oxidase [Propionibacterium freudenreichii]MDK9324724.1 protoporphyrinogen oxidase [Propionibacterium freudenreichii]MDK9340312.1 protoporphyrinogen oxidase [Propionibacterium freudenreichii]MDK9642927.1 protoporphyrinogen oxidase [Propionibacterium freudenreichii]
MSTTDRVTTPTPTVSGTDVPGTDASHCHLVVVGGGITGLAAAWQGMTRGARVSVVESDDHFGGKVVTDRRDGFLVEQGPDSFVAYRPAALKLIEELGLSDQVIAPGGGRRVSLLSRGRLRPMPAGMGMVLPTRMWPFVTTTVLSWPDKIRAGLDLVIPRRLPDHDVAIGAFLRQRLGDGIVRRFADPMVGGIYGAGIDELSLDAVLPSLRDNERDHRSLMVASLAGGRASRRAARQRAAQNNTQQNSTGRNNSAGTRGPAASPFRTLCGGLGQLIDALVDQLRAGGVELMANTSVDLLDRDGVHLSDGRVLPADAVVLAGGVASSARLLRPQLPAAARALAQIPLASTTIVSLAWPVSAFDVAPDSQGWLEADASPFSGLTASSIKFAGRAPDGSVLMRVFVPDKRGPLTDAPDDELLGAVIDHVRPLLGVHGAPSLTQVTRWHTVMPKYTVGHLERAAVVDSTLAEQRPTWAVAGSALHGVGLPDCISDARHSADEVIDAALAATPSAPTGNAATDRTETR